LYNKNSYKIYPSGEWSEFEYVVSLLLGTALNTGQLLWKGVIEKVQNAFLVVGKIGLKECLKVGNKKYGNTCNLR
jgi:hypothetical protein